MRVMRMLMDDELGARPEMRETEVFMLRGDEEEKKRRRGERRERWKRKEENRLPGHGTGQGRQERGMISQLRSLQSVVVVVVRVVVDNVIMVCTTDHC